MENKPILNISTSSLNQSIEPKCSILSPVINYFKSIKKRHVLALYAFFGFFFAYVFRANLSVAIVEMSKLKNSDDDLNLNKTIFTTNKDWSPILQGYILSSFFYGYIFTQIPAAYLSTNYGGKTLYGLGIGICAILSMLMPLAAYMGSTCLIILRIIQGLSQGFIYPSMHCLWSKWSPPSERSRLATFALSGSYIGSVTALSVGGLIGHYFNWQSIFYIFGLFGILWTVLWFMNIFESPSEHSDITNEEKLFIESSLTCNDSSKIPWASILKSPPVWAIVSAHFAENWGFYTMLTEMPTFLADVLKYNIDKAGILSALPYLIMAKVLYLSGLVSDKLVEKKMKFTTVRKIFCCSGFFAQSFFMFLMTVTTRPSLLIIFVTFSIGFGGMPWSSFGVNHLDIGAGYANVLMSITNTFATIPGIISPTLTGHLIEDKVKSEWNAVFMISAFIFLLGGIIYYLLGTGETQYWAISSKDFEAPQVTTYSNDISRNSTFSISEANSNLETDIKDT